jgi:hypothetical protein
MRDQILNLVKNKPKQYSRLIKSNPILREWVNKNSLLISDHWPEMIYSAIYQVSKK